jgi:small-conductance mechanosensitive channel
MHDRLTALLGPVAGVFDAGTVEAMALRILGAALVLLAAFWISKTAQRYLVRRLQGHDADDEQAIRLYRRIVRAVVWVIAGGIALHTLGIDLTHIFTTGGLFAVALAFGDSSVVYRVLVWIEDPWIAGWLRSALNEAIWWALKDAGVVIAFPQLDVHIAPDALADTAS